MYEHLSYSRLIYRRLRQYWRIVQSQSRVNYHCCRYRKKSVYRIWNVCDICISVWVLYSNSENTWSAISMPPDIFVALVVVGKRDFLTSAKCGGCIVAPSNVKFGTVGCPAGTCSRICNYRYLEGQCRNLLICYFPRPIVRSKGAYRKQQCRSEHSRHDKHISTKTPQQHIFLIIETAELNNVGTRIYTHYWNLLA